VAPTLTELSAGHSFETIRFSIDAERARAYVAATGDANAIYEQEGFVPPLAVAAVALGYLLELVSLPSGSLHLSESLDYREPVPAGAALECKAALVQRSQRAGMIVSVLDTEVLHEGRTALTARATVMSPL
jgi:hypothetical protein